MLKDFLQGKWLGHPLHAAIVHVPTALWPAAVVFDLLSMAGMGGNVMVRTSFYAILIGLIAVLGAVPTGIADWSEIKRDRPAWRIGLYHMGLNLLAALIFAISLGLRTGEAFAARSVEMLPFLLAVIGTVILLVSGYLGGLMVYDYGVGVGRTSKKQWKKRAEAGGANVGEADS